MENKYRWSAEKNEQLRKVRRVTFEQLIEGRFFLGIEGHPKRSHQKLMLFEYKKYVWVIPYVENEDHRFLKTAFRSRKHAKKYLGDKNEKVS